MSLLLIKQASTACQCGGWVMQGGFGGCSRGPTEGGPALQGDAEQLQQVPSLAYRPVGVFRVANCPGGANPCRLRHHWRNRLRRQGRSTGRAERGLGSGLLCRELPSLLRRNSRSRWRLASTTRYGARWDPAQWPVLEDAGPQRPDPGAAARDRRDPRRYGSSLGSARSARSGRPNTRRPRPRRRTPYGLCSWMSRDGRRGIRGSGGRVSAHFRSARAAGSSSPTARRVSSRSRR